MSKGIMVVAEQSDGVLRKVTFEVLSEGKRIADKLGCQLTAVVLGADIAASAQELQAYGPDRILAVEDSQLSDYLTDAYTNALSEVIQQEDPGILLFGASVQGKDLSARVAARIDAPLAADCVAITCDGDAVDGHAAHLWRQVAGKCRFGRRAPAVFTAPEHIRNHKNRW